VVHRSETKFLNNFNLDVKNTKFYDNFKTIEDVAKKGPGKLFTEKL
jgi:hypothetical protein